MTLVGAIKIIQTIHKVSKIYNKRISGFDPGLRTIDKFAPPHLRKPLRTLYKIGTAGTIVKGVSDELYNYMSADDSPGNGPISPYVKPFKTGKLYQTRRRQTIRNCVRRRRYNKFNGRN